MEYLEAKRQMTDIQIQIMIREVFGVQVTYRLGQRFRKIFTR